MKKIANFKVAKGLNNGLKMKLFSIEWASDEGGGLAEIFAYDMIDALNSFCEYWGDVPKVRRIVRVTEDMIFDYYND